MSQAENKTVVITGGSGAIGAALVRCFAGAGYTVAYTYLTNAAPVCVCDNVFARQCDVRDTEAITALAKEFDANVLINNAGISKIKPLQDITEHDWEEMLSINLTGAYKFTRAFLPGMVRRKQGCVINVSSVWGVCGASCETHYSAAKAGLVGFTKALSKEVGLSNVRVNCVAPGLIESPMNAFVEPDDALYSRISLARAGNVNDVANAALYLAGAEYVTGVVLRVDGGMD